MRAAARPAPAMVPTLYGRALRFVLVDMIRRRGEMTVADMVSAIHDAGYPVEGRLSKVISDALRWEVGHGRVVRVGRGRYRYGRPSDTTGRRIRLFAAHSRARLVATRRQEPPPPTPPDRRQADWTRPDDPPRAPWYNTA